MDPAKANAKGVRAESGKIRNGGFSARGGLLTAVTALSLATCYNAPPATVADFGEPWTSEPEFEFGETIGGGRHAVAAAVLRARRSADAGARRTGDR